MSPQDWICEVCKQPNCSDSPLCLNCECPCDAGNDEISRRRNCYSGPILDHLVDTTIQVMGRPKPFSDNWWNEGLSRTAVSIAIFPVCSVAGALAVIGGAVISGRPLQIDEPIYGALIFGTFMSIRNLLRPFGIGPVYGTRKNITLWFIAISLVTLAFVFYALVKQQP